MKQPNALAFSGDIDSDNMLGAFREVRLRSEELVAKLSPEDCIAQSMPDASPAKWHLAHVSWYFETFLLEPLLPGYRSPNPKYRVLYNSYYNGIGEQHARPERGLVTRPSLAEVFAYRHHVDAQMEKLIQSGNLAEPEHAAVFELGLHHEQQHQELLLMDIKHLFSRNPLAPAYRAISEAPTTTTGHSAPAISWHGFEATSGQFGAADKGFSFDNERPRHAAMTSAFELASRPVSNAEFLEFVRDDGYQQAALWLSDAWAQMKVQPKRHPYYWHEQEGQWFEFTLRGMRPLEPAAPASHLSFFESEAYATWAGARLPTEYEWETAARELAVQGNFYETGALHPQASVDTTELQQMFGDVWEWTRSNYSPYPGFRPPAGAVGEYNGKFMNGQYVLRGGACVTPSSHARLHYRNFFYPHTHWHFSGARLARDIV